MDTYAIKDARYQKDLEESQIRHDVYTNIIENCQWSTAEMEVLGHSYIIKLQRVRSYLKDAIDTINNELERMDENE